MLRPGDRPERATGTQRAPHLAERIVQTRDVEQHERHQHGVEASGSERQRLSVGDDPGVRRRRAPQHRLGQVSADEQRLRHTGLKVVEQASRTTPKFGHPSGSRQVKAFRERPSVGGEDVCPRPVVRGRDPCVVPLHALLVRRHGAFPSRRWIGPMSSRLTDADRRSGGPCRATARGRTARLPRRSH